MCYKFMFCLCYLSMHIALKIFYFSVLRVLVLFREMDLLLVPYWADRELDLIQWPPFLLASKVFFRFRFFYDTLLLACPLFFLVERGRGWANCLPI